MEEIVTLAHGAGGAEMSSLIKKLVDLVSLKKIEGGTGLSELEDSALLPVGEGNYLAITTDSYTVNPIFFPGGNIGKLAATGTINDLAVMGAKPLAFLDTIVVEEGFPLDKLYEIVKSMVDVLEKKNIALIGGDFKVMPRGSLDKIVISTTGVGFVSKENLIRNNGLKLGDKIIVSGTIGDHGAVIMACQAGIEVESSLTSDCTPVIDIIETVQRITKIHAAKDPTRGGLAMALNDLAKKSEVSIIIYEENIPIKEEVLAYCEMLGVDPLVLACEGRVVMGVEGSIAEEVLKELKSRGYTEAAIIGEAVDKKPPRVYMKTSVGGTRIVEEPMGEIVPRIC
ncbi:MAG: hydrogenase expression/formation protein HypE [Thermoprotei archaeon]|nr:MAG: hydrogenase expression/formation protein HypE [Thermoprotei archaeon]